jgi:hypothetical protein
MGRVRVGKEWMDGKGEDGRAWVDGKFEGGKGVGGWEG